MTLQLTRDSEYTRGFMSARSVTGFLSDVYSAAADEVGKIHIIADDKVCTYTLFIVIDKWVSSIQISNVDHVVNVQVQGAVFDLPEEIAKELLNRQIPPGNTVSKITKVLYSI